MTLPTDRGAIVVGWLLQPDFCELCGGRGWISVDDAILGGVSDVRCPECSRSEGAR